MGPTPCMVNQGSYQLRDITKWIERLYVETDVGRSVATSLSGVVGLLVYIRIGDWVVAAFTLLIVFPIARVASGWIHGKMLRRAERRLKLSQSREVLARLSKAERVVVQAFLDKGGTVLTWSHVNALGLPGPAFESLVARGLIIPSVTADAVRETFVLDSEIFDVARTQPQDDSV
jgi:ABC-type multidrug transport system fused ATPase/permease subunit